MTTVTLLNEKGGVGKTTVALHLAAGLAINGHRVVFLDTDPQANATAALGLPKAGAFYDLIVRAAPWKDVLRAVHPDVYGQRDTPPKGELYAVPGNVESRNIDTSISSAGVFRSRVRELRTSVDYVIVDTSPTPSLFHGAILAGTDYALIPTQCEVFSAFDGLANTLLVSEVARQQAQEHGITAAAVAGILPTIYENRQVTHNMVLEKLRAEYGALVWEPLEKRVDYRDAAYARQIVYAFAPRSKAAKQLWALVARVEQLAKAGIHEQTH